MTLRRPLVPLSVGSFALVAACHSAHESVQAPPHDREFARSIEAHAGADAWRAHRAARMDIEVTFGGAPLVAGTATYATDGTAARLDTAVGDTVVWTWDDGRCWHLPAEGEGMAPPMARFQVLTWAYFLALPVKLNDAGTQLRPEGRVTWEGREYDTARLTFGEDVGDAPDDWYLLYRDVETGRLAAAAYIVSYGKSKDAAEQEPHAVVYRDPERIDGFEVPMRWTFHEWSADDGIGTPIGEARIHDFAFVDPAPGRFAAPAGASVVPAPGG